MKLSRNRLAAGEFPAGLACIAVAAMMVVTSAQAQNTAPSASDSDRRDQQISDLQRQIDELKALLKQGAQGTVESRTTSTPSASNAPANMAPSPDRVRLSETPSGYRFINTETTNIGIYGLLDLTIGSSSTGGPNANPNAATGGVTNKRWTGLDVSWMNGNRWGIQGSHVLDKETATNLVIKLESEFELPTGNFDGGYTAPVLFNRDAWIGLQSPTLGLLTFGRQDSLGRDVNMIWANPFSTDKNGYSEGGWMNNQVMYQLMEYSGSPTGNRWDSSVVWKKVSGNWMASLGYQFAGLQNTQPSNGGTDVVDTGKGLKGTQQAVGIGYNSTDNIWHASASATHANYDGYGKKVFSLGGNFRPIHELRLNGGVYRADIGQPIAVGNRKDLAWTLSAQIYPAGKFDYALAYYHISATNAGNAGGNTLQPFDLTANIASAASGKWDTFYGAAFYRWDSQTDFYLAWDTSRVSGGYNSGYFNGNRNINQVGLGARYFF